MPAARSVRDAELKDFVRTKNSAMRTLLQTVEKILDHDVSILLLGESDVGKDHFAEAIHACGVRRDKPLVRIDCAAIPADLLALSTPTYNGAWVFTDSKNRKAWTTQKTILLPRVGAAFRVNDKTALNIGFARYVVPVVSGNGASGAPRDCMA